MSPLFLYGLNVFFTLKNVLSSWSHMYVSIIYDIPNIVDVEQHKLKGGTNFVEMQVV